MRFWLAGWYPGRQGSLFGGRCVKRQDRFEFRTKRQGETAEGIRIAAEAEDNASEGFAWFDGRL